MKLIDSDAPLKRRMRQLGGLMPSNPENDRNIALRGIYEVRLSLGEPVSSSSKAEFLDYCAEHGLEKGDQSYVRCIIELKGPAHWTPKMKRAYELCLESARKDGVPAAKLLEYIKENGGINKCANGS